MIYHQITSKTGLKHNESYVGESIETKVERITVNREPISDGAPIIFTERKDGVMAGYDVRTDRWDVALDAMEKVEKSKAAKRDNKPEEKAEAEKAEVKSE